MNKKNEKKGYTKTNERYGLKKKNTFTNEKYIKDKKQKKEGENQRK